MRIKPNGRTVWWLVSVSCLAISSAFGGTDLRLVEAAKQGDKQAVRSLLKQHADVNTPQADGTTALAWAAYRDDLEMVELLIQSGAKTNLANDYGATPLLLACSNGSAAMVDRLLDAGADANSAAWGGETPLMRCAATGNLETVKALLAHRADVNAKETLQWQTALMWAAAKKYPTITAALIEHGPDVNASSKSGFTPLMFAAQQGDMESARMLVAAGANVNAVTLDGDTPLLVASLSGQEELAIFLLDKGANPSAAEHNGITALHYAMLSGLQQLVDISPLVRGSLSAYLHRPNMTELVKALLARGANPNARLTSHAILNDAVSGYGKIYRVGFLSPGEISPFGATPFLAAAASYDANLMRMLAAAGANTLLTTDEGVTPLMAAAGLPRHRGPAGDLPEQEEKRALEAVKVAVELGADVNATTNIGLTALHGAAFCGLNTVVEFLAKNGANLDARDQAEQTPLHKALMIKPSGADVATNLVSNRLRKSTADLLLKLGATPVDAPGSQGINAATATVRQ